MLKSLRKLKKNRFEKLQGAFNILLSLIEIYKETMYILTNASIYKHDLIGKPTLRAYKIPGF